MLSCDQVERLLCQLAAWDRETLLRQFLTYRSSFPIDLTADYLGGQPVDKLRHVFFAICVQNRRLPDLAEPHAVAA